jgi:hypothetical protein
VCCCVIVVVDASKRGSSKGDSDFGGECILPQYYIETSFRLPARCVAMTPQGGTREEKIKNNIEHIQR